MTIIRLVDGSFELRPVVGDSYSSLSSELWKNSLLRTYQNDTKCVKCQGLVTKDMISVPRIDNKTSVRVQRIHCRRCTYAVFRFLQEKKAFYFQNNSLPRGTT